MTSRQPGPGAPGARHRPGPLGGSNRMLSAGQVAEILGGGISAKTVLAYRHAWGLKSVKVDKQDFEKRPMGCKGARSRPFRPTP